MREKTSAGGALHRPNVYITDVLRDDRVAPEQRQCLDVQLHGQDDTLGHSCQPDVPRRAILDVEQPTCRKAMHREQTQAHRANAVNITSITRRGTIPAQQLIVTATGLHKGEEPY
jgi:hypothetical protein